MGYLKYVRKLWQDPQSNANYRDLLLQLRREPVTLRVERPMNIARARSLGYKPKQGVIVVRQRVIRGGKMRPDIKGGRRTAHSGQSKVIKKNYQQIAEERAAVKYQNCEVLNSYKLLEDGQFAWYEVILVDRMHPAVLADPQLRGIARQQGRAFRGLTSAGRRERGLRQKGIGAEKQRPSLAAHNKLH
jgi:large subunit ribosomal protein L15e